MGLLDDLSNVESFGKVQSLYCGMCKLLKELPTNEREALDERMKDERIGHALLSRILKQNGYNISDGVIGRHRRGLCTGVAK